MNFGLCWQKTWRRATILLVVACCLHSGKALGEDIGKADAEREKAIEESLDMQTAEASASQIKKETIKKTREVSEKPVSKVQEEPLPGKTVAPKTKEVPPQAVTEETEKEPGPEKDIYLIVDDVRWDAVENMAVFELRVEDKNVLKGMVTVSENGKTVRWRGAVQIVARVKKENPVPSALLQNVRFVERPEVTKKLGLQAPYYALDEIVIQFARPVFFDLQEAENWMRIEFSPRVKEEKDEEKEDATMTAIQAAAAQFVSPMTTQELLGSLYQAKDQFEAFVVGGDKIMEMLTKLRSEKRTARTFFDPWAGLPEDIGPAFRQEYPAFGTAEFWKKHVRAALRQTYGFSSNFNGILSRAGTQTKQDSAFSWQPDVDLNFRRFGFTRRPGQKLQALRTDIKYRTRRIFPMGSRLSFGDGLRSQDIGFNFDYYPQKRFSLSSRNNVSLFGGKQLDYRVNRQGQKYWTKNPKHGYRITNALGFNYRLTPLLTWRSGIGLERTRSDDMYGRSRDKTVYVNTSIDTKLTKRARLELGYGHRFLLKDTDPFSGKPLTRKTKAKNLDTLTGHFRYRISSRFSIEGGPDVSIIDGEIPKIGGRGTVHCRIRPKDYIKSSYYNGLIQDNTRKILGGVSSGTLNTISRLERVGVSYWHAIELSTNAKNRLGASFDYLRKSPMSGVYGQQATIEDWMIFELTWLRKLRYGLMWLELTYRYSQYRSKAAQYSGTANDSLHEHMVYLALTNYFGEWEEMT